MKFGGAAKKDKVKTVDVSVRGIINKLCPENYDKLSKEIMSLNWVESEEILSTCTKLVFEKAIDEPHFSGIYADLCVDLTNQFKRADDLDFRKGLIKAVQEQFQKYNEKSEPDENGETDVIERLTNKDVRVIEFRIKLVEAKAKAVDPENKMTDKEKKIAKSEVISWEEEIDERRKKIKKRRYGNITFIGHLFERDLQGGFVKIPRKCSKFAEKWLKMAKKDQNQPF